MKPDMYKGLSKTAYYHRLRNWTTKLYDKDGNEYLVSPKHCMRSGKAESVEPEQVNQDK